MKYFVTIILTLTSSVLLSQEGIYKYCDNLQSDDCSTFILENDRYTYQFSRGMSAGKSKGDLTRKQDTLVFNSDLQPFQEIRESFNKNLDGYFSVRIHNAKFVLDSLTSSISFFIGFRHYKGRRDDKYNDLNLNDPLITTIQYDSTNDIKTFLFNCNLIKGKKRMNFIIYRTNLELALKVKPSFVNQIDIFLNDLQDDFLDYNFFTDQQAVVTKDGIVLIENGKQEHTRIMYRSGRFFRWKKKNGTHIRTSKRAIVKEYKKLLGS